MGGWRKKKQSKKMKMRDERLQNLVSDYENRDTLEYLRGMANNFASDFHTFFISFLHINCIY